MAIVVLMKSVIRTPSSVSGQAAVVVTLLSDVPEEVACESADGTITCHPEGT